MADIENLSKKIIDDAESEGAAVKSSARENASIVISRAKENADKVLNEAKATAELLYKESYEKRISQNEAVKRQDILKKKMEIVEGVLKKIREEIENLPKDSYRDYFKKNSTDISITDGEFMIGNKEKNIDAAFVKQLFKSAKLTLSKDSPDFDYGIKIISGGALYTLSILSDLEYRKDKILSIMNRELFKEETN